MNKRLVTFGALSLFLFTITFGGAFTSSVLSGGTTFINKIGAQVGISVGVSPNEFTKLAQEVTQKQAEIEAREIAVAEREKALERREETSGIFSLELYVTVIAFILLILVLLNFYLDWRRDYYVDMDMR
jgi:hypothetical protein